MLTLISFQLPTVYKSIKYKNDQLNFRSESRLQETEHRLRSRDDRVGVQRGRLSPGVRRVRGLSGERRNTDGRLGQGGGGEAEEGRREEGEEGHRQLEEVDQGHADASEDQKQVFGKGKELTSK